MTLVLAVISFVAKLTDMMKRNIPLHPLLVHLWPWRQLSWAALLFARLHSHCLWQAEAETPSNNLLHSKTARQKIGWIKKIWVTFLQAVPDVNWSVTGTQLCLAFQSVWDHIRRDIYIKVNKVKTWTPGLLLLFHERPNISPWCVQL